MASNTHFEGTVRIQTDRDHQVIDRGPYGYVRHPGYVAFVLMMLSLPALLGSLAAYHPSFLRIKLDDPPADRRYSRGPDEPWTGAEQPSSAGGEKG